MVLSAKPELSQLIFSLLTGLMNHSLQHTDYDILTLPDFQQLWKVSHQNPTIREYFYNWLLTEKIEMFTGKVRYEINASFSDQLKEEIFNKLLCDFNQLDYINLTLQQFHLFQEFLFATNLIAQRVQILHFNGMVRAVRVKEQEIIGNKFVWDIFMNCKNEEVLQELNELILLLNVHC